MTTHPPSPSPADPPDPPPWRPAPARSRAGEPDGAADVIVVGSRVAGAATALLLARAGHEVVMVDRTRHPSDTLSTHAIARGGVVQLARWGVLDAVLATGAPPVREVSFHAAGGVVRRTVKDTAGVDHLVAPRRHALDPVLADAAVAAGARLIEGVAVTDVQARNRGEVGVVLRDADGTRSSITARHVVGADGIRSTVAEAVGAPIVDLRPSSAATHYVYVRGLDGSDIEYHLGGGGFAGVFPTNDAEACIWMCSPMSWVPRRRGDAGARMQWFLAELAGVSPSLAARVSRSVVTAPVRGAVGLPNQVRRPAGPGWWLVGDAGYHRDPITGHGITDALRDAELVAEAVHACLAGHDERVARVCFQQRRDAALAPIFDLTCELAGFPDEQRFVALQKELGGRIEEEALRLHRTGPRPWTRPAMPACV